MELSATDAGRGKSVLDGGPDMAFIPLILSTNYTSIEVEQRSRAIEVAHKLMTIYCAGSVTRAYYENGMDTNAPLDLDVPAQDNKQIEAIQKFLKLIDNEHADDFVQQTMKQVLKQVQDPGTWKAIEALAAAALNKQDAPVKRFEIEDALTAAGMKVRHIARSGFSVGLMDKEPVVSAKQEPVSPPGHEAFETETTLDILLKDFFKKIRKDWNEEDVAHAVVHVRGLFEKYK
jgi:hypothetical protein